MGIVVVFVSVAAMVSTAVAQSINASPTNGTVLSQNLNEPGPTLSCRGYATIGGGLFQQPTQWFVTELGKSRTAIATNTTTFALSGETLGNGLPATASLTVLNVTSNLDGATLDCYFPNIGVGGTLAGVYPLKIYRPPVLKSVGTVTGLNNRSVSFQIGDTSSPPPYPLNTISFTVVGNGSLTTAQMQYSHPNMTLTGLTENNIGSYVLTASNKRLSDDTIIGSSTGSFNLNVQFSTVITPGPSLVVVALGQPATLVCGTNLRSNPPSSVLWRNSNGVTVTTGGRYAYGNGSDNVYIIVSNTTTSDNGTWSCVLNNGVFRPLTVNIVLFIVVPPSQPNNVTANDVSDNTTQLYISWKPPYSLGVPPVSVYMVTATSSLDPYPRNRTVNTTAALFTQLRPGLSYDITVVGVSVFQGILAVGPVSDKVVLSTEPTVPSLMCGGLIAASGIVSVSWSVDSGGKDITAVQIAYTLAGTDQQYQPIQASVTPSVTSVIVREQFVASRSYSFQISANNSVGISNIATCGPVFIKEGIPIRPDEPQIISTKPGTITLTLSTAASGSGATGSFKFIISSVPSIDTMPSTYSFPAYIDGQKVSIIISNIKEGVLYYFSIYASNLYGTSPAQFAIRFPNSTVAPATTPATIAPATEKQASSVAGPVAGGVIGGIVFVMVILIIVVFTTYLVLRQRVHKMKQKAVQMEQNSAYGMVHGEEGHTAKQKKAVEPEENIIYETIGHPSDTCDTRQNTAYGIIARADSGKVGFSI